MTGEWRKGRRLVVDSWVVHCVGIGAPARSESLIHLLAVIVWSRLREIARRTRQNENVYAGYQRRHRPGDGSFSSIDEHVSDETGRTSRGNELSVIRLLSLQAVSCIHMVDSVINLIRSRSTINRALFRTAADVRL